MRGFFFFISAGFLFFFNPLYGGAAIKASELF
jgi:hypothetical protein